ncbi:hypothetical protein IEQ34_016774 [Dendrobium chrysotoxum]|uniref:Uncharacterized protein n=1 Tax=Dendrobium chrysotoxum TaxID=161865 RepID=A0AAV7GGI2_DENCH|nr:hypothetical protein IEQ34_016774 [Dendrobium chrysotoxum]
MGGIALALGGHSDAFDGKIDGVSFWAMRLIGYPGLYDAKSQRIKCSIFIGITSTSALMLCSAAKSIISCVSFMPPAAEPLTIFLPLLIICANKKPISPQEFNCLLLFVRRGADDCDAHPHSLGKLDGHMAEATEADDTDL